MTQECITAPLPVSPEEAVPKKAFAGETAGAENESLLKHLLRSGGWRYPVYGLFILIRLIQHARDTPIPVYDGAYYVEKALWMAADAWPRAFSSEAFSHTAIRPPGPMWLLLPFLVISPTLASFVLGMSCWIVAFVETGVRGLAGSLRRWRDPAGIALVFATGLFFSPRDAYLVDALLAAQTVAVLGLGVAWLRSGSRRTAFAMGTCLGLALLTKPAGAYLIAATACSLTLAMGLVWWRSGRHKITRSLLSRGGELALFCGLPTALAVAALLFTPYSETLKFPDQMRIPSLANYGHGTPFSRDNWSRAFDLVGRNLGLWSTLAFVTTALVFTVRAARRARPERIAGAAMCLTATVLFITAIAGTPVIQGRYLAPAALGVVACAVAATAARGTRSALRVIWACAVTAAAAQLLILAGIAPGKWGWGQFAVADPQTNAKALYSAFSLSASRCPSSHPVLLATNLAAECQIFGTGQFFRSAGFPAVVPGPHPPKEYSLKGPDFPACSLRPLGSDFLRADYLICMRPGVVPKASPKTSSADWQHVNDRLWEARQAASLGWNELLRTSSAVIYMSGDDPHSSQTLPWMAERARWLAGQNLQSPESADLRRQLVVLGQLEELSPPGRSFHHKVIDGNSLELLLHAEYRGNNFHDAATLRLRPGSKLRASMVKNKGDGVVLKVAATGFAPEVTRTVERAVTGTAPVEIPLADLFPHGATPTSPVSVTVKALPGPADNAFCDALLVRILPPEN